MLQYSVKNVHCIEKYFMLMTFRTYKASQIHVFYDLLVLYKCSYDELNHIQHWLITS